MFRWYKEAVVCYVLLEDLLSDVVPEDGFPHCRWFTRGWTLQELLAPERVEFYDQTWAYVGTKDELAVALSAFTHISYQVLIHPRRIYARSVAERMSWASKRITDREEDMAYCLLGIFEVNMPLIYGEGEKAFRRLQEEIIKRNNDLSILAWERPHGRCNGVLFHALANSPDAFPFMSARQIRSVVPTAEFSLTNRGFQVTGNFKLWYREYHMRAKMSTYVLCVGANIEAGTLEIALRKLAPRLYCRTGNLLLRGGKVNDYDTDAMTCSKGEDSVYILTDFHRFDHFEYLTPPRDDALHIPVQEYFNISRVTPKLLWDHSDAVFLEPRHNTPFPRYDSVVAVEFIFSVKGYQDHLAVVYQNIPLGSCLHVFRSRGEPFENIATLALFGRGAPERGILWEDLIIQAPWLESRGNSIVVELGGDTFRVTFFLENGELELEQPDFDQADASAIVMVTNLKSSVEPIEPRIQST
jgi:hypothetical protein